jgi:hypothetical protein
MELQNNNINDNIININMNGSVNNDLICISVKSKKEPHKRCNCKKKILNGVLQSYCGKHIKSNNKIVFCSGNTEVNANTVKAVNRRFYTSTSLPICINCNIIQLCNSLFFHNIPYVKSDSFINLYNKLKTKFRLIEEYNTKNNHIIVIQKNVRKHLIYRMKHFTNNEDFYTLDSIFTIPFKYTYIIHDSEKISYCFDIRSLHRYIELTKNEIINPYKNIPFMNDELIKIKKSIAKLNKNELVIEKDIITPQQYYKQYLVTVFQKFDVLGYLTNIEWFTKLNFIQIKDLYKRCEDIWNYRASLTLEQKKNIVHDGLLFTASVNVVNRLRISNDLELRKIVLNQFDKALSQGKTIADKNHGAILMLTGFAEVSNDVRQSFPWLIQMV